VEGPGVPGYSSCVAGVGFEGFEGIEVFGGFGASEAGAAAAASRRDRFFIARSALRFLAARSQVCFLFAMVNALQLREGRLARPVAPSRASYLPADGHATAGCTAIAARGRWRTGPETAMTRRITILSLALLMACGRADAPDTARPDDAPARPRLVEDLRLDANAEDFSLVGRVAVGADGRMAIALPQDMEVRLYDPAGNRIASVGRRGGGPGEFKHLGAMTWIGDTLMVDDQRQRRVTYIDAAGAVLRTVPLPGPMAPTALSATSADTTFRFFIAHSGSTTGDILGMAHVSVGPPSSTGSSPWRVLSLAPDGSARIIAQPPQYEDERWTVTIAGLSNYIPFALRPQIVFAVDGSRIAFLTADQSTAVATYSLTVLNADGEPLFARDYSLPGEAIPPAAVDSAIAAMAPPGQPREEGSDPSRFQALARERMPAVYAPVERVMLAVDGTTWLTMRATAAGTEALILDAHGTLVSTVPLPPRSRVQNATSTNVWMTETDEFDLVSVVRYRIER
jgi:hypothetical protein